MDSVEEFCPAGPKEWRSWLAQNHANKDAVWLIFYRKSSFQHNLTWSESVDEALCFGWIDSTKRTIDKESYKQYFTKRKPKSNWSRINKDKVKELIANGRMQGAGLKSIEVAKENGSWTILDTVEDLILPDDLKKALEETDSAMDFYESLSKSIKKGLLYWVISAKRPETREKRVREIVGNAGNQTLPKQFLTR